MSLLSYALFRSPVVGSDGLMTRPWQQFMTALLERAGGISALTNSELQLFESINTPEQTVPDFDGRVLDAIQPNMLPLFTDVPEFAQQPVMIPPPADDPSLAFDGVRDVSKELLRLAMQALTLQGDEALARSLVARIAALEDAVQTTGSFTATGTGFTSNPTDTAYWAKMGTMVTLYLPTLSGESNATSFTVIGMDAAITPARNPIFLAYGQDNNTGLAAYIRVGLTASSTTISLAPSATVSTWAGSGTKTLHRTCISYLTS